MMAKISIYKAHTGIIRPVVILVCVALGPTVNGKETMVSVLASLQSKGILLHVFASRHPKELTPLLSTVYAFSNILSGQNSGVRGIHRALFSGEDLLQNDPWHHEGFSKEACAEVGFSTPSAENVAWHADYVDSYCYNPLWWFNLGDGGGYDRFKASRSISPDLKKVHFDDLNFPQQVITAFYRYINGCLVGLNWAAEVYDEPSLAPGIDPIGAAHNLLGVALHAIQDFYSHSNWIDDPSHRDKIFFDVPIRELETTFLYTGYYEEDLGIKPHGKYSLICLSLVTI